MLKELLRSEMILLGVEATDWMDAIRKSAAPLLDMGAIEGRYIDEIIRKVNSYGPYIVIAPGIALPHARPEEGAKELAISLATLKEPVPFGSVSNDPVRLVITFSAPDSDSHLSMLAQLMNLLTNPESLETILHSTSKEAVLSVIRAVA